MADLLADGLAWLDDQLQAHAAQTITYRRTVESVELTVMFDERTLRIVDRQGNSKVERPDFTCSFAAEDLDFGFGQTEPAHGDLMDVTYGDTIKRFRVMPLNNGLEPGWQYLDPHQIRVQVSGKFTGTV